MFRPTILLRATRIPSMPLRKTPTRSYAAQPPPPFPPPPERIARFNRRLPKFLHKYTNALGNAPLTHITSFLILHEITAVVPLLGLAATFHYTHWLPGWFTEGKWVLQGVDRFGKYFRKKGWIQSEDAVEAEREVEGLRLRDRAWGIGEGGTRLVVEFATAYAVTKMLLPLRIIASIWGTPWFAKAAVVPALGAAKKWFGWGRAAKPGASGQGAVGTGASPKPGMKKDSGS